MEYSLTDYTLFVLSSFALIYFSAFLRLWLISFVICVLPGSGKIWPKEYE